MVQLLKRPRFLAVLTLLAVLIAGAVQFALSARRVDAAPVQQAAAPALAIVTVAASLPPGHMIRPGDLTELAWPQGDPPPGAIVSGTPQAQELAGSVTRRTLDAGELVHAAAVIRPGERGFLSALVAPGNRAIAIAVDATTSAGGLIWPGDRVDVILTQELRDDAVPLAQRVLAETILSNVRILSADQRLTPAGQSAPSPTDVASDPAKPGVPATVTLEVTPVEAERVTVAGTLGRLHLTLRGVTSAANEAPVPAMWAGGVSPSLAGVRQRPTQALSAAPVAPVTAAAPAARPDSVRIYRGSNGDLK
ncbi:Flp pilus assembly protein CpaB [Sandarakinorhabdus sp.]|uniref:Flp pilus assembly protein CpaB n=1 Tax=Sandarakinorhabdus sp. TaxID=1916663 RepID=UPI00286E2372|nr:Flp pilus assembly protein CpaB [Sandarakinorhabdus sp.]